MNSSGGDGPNSSGASRALVKDRFVFQHYPSDYDFKYIKHLSDPDENVMVSFRLKIFNLQFEELHQRQSQWTVPDSELRESLRLAVAEVLLPAYRSFIRRFGYGFLISWVDLSIVADNVFFL